MDQAGSHFQVLFLCPIVNLILIKLFYGCSYFISRIFIVLPQSLTQVPSLPFLSYSPPNVPSIKLVFYFITLKYVICYHTIIEKVSFMRRLKINDILKLEKWNCCKMLCWDKSPITSLSPCRRLCSSQQQIGSTFVPNGRWRILSHYRGSNKVSLSSDRF